MVGAKIPKNDRLIDIARSLRKNMTPQEKKLWYQFLSSYPTRFYRQRIIGDYIADFYCPKSKLVVELDGSQHYTAEGENRDSIRTACMERYGIMVIRFSNLEMAQHFEGICVQIDQIVTRRMI